MSNRLIQYGFTAGIVSETLWGQTILQKYGYGLADCKNYIVEFTGVLTSRPGLVASTLVLSDISENFRFVPFVFAQEDANTFALLFVPSKVYFLQQGRFQLEAAKAITATSSNGTTTLVTCTSHGYSVGDLIEFYGGDVPTALVGQTVIVTSVPDANSFRVQQIDKTEDMDGWTDAAIADGEAFKVYSLATPYDDDDLEGLYFSQTRDVVDITSLDLAPRELERQADGTWTLSVKDIDIQMTGPTGLAGTPSTTDVSGLLMTATGINAQGEESAPEEYLLLTGIVDYSVTFGSVKFTWNAAPGAVRYNVYRSIISHENAITKGLDVGLLGSCFTPEFEDRNFTPDYTKTPPRRVNPFVNNRITFIEVTNGGTGYARTDSATVNDPTGSGAEVLLVVNISGVVIGVIVLNGGSGYTNPSLSITTSGGSGATFSFTVGADSGNYPSVSGLHEQRKVYAASANNPLTVWGSHIGLFDNFTRSRIVTSDESYEYGLSSPVLGFVKHLVSTRTGLLAFTNIGIWSLAASVGAISATDAEADLQTAVGCSELVPLSIDADIAYAETNNRTIRLLRYNDFSKNFGGTDISVLARELFENWYDLTTWSFETRPYKLIWTTRNDGQMLSCTVSQEQDVYAWHRHDTDGIIEANLTLPESNREVTYALVRRYLNGRWVRVIEYHADRTKSINEDHIGVDCAVPFGHGNMPNATLTVDETVDPVEITASSAIFSVADEGKYIRYREGKALITNFVSTTKVEVEIINEFTSIKVPYSGRNKTIPAGDWHLTTLTSSFQLPLNFRPDTVTVFGDGKVFPDIEVGSDGTVTFPEEVAFGYIGLGFECHAITLPLTAENTIIEDSRKDVLGVGIRFKDSKGIEVGTAADDTYPIEQILHENLVEATLLRSGHEHVLVSSDWDEDTRIHIKANGAVPTQISSIVIDLEVGDDLD